MADNYSPTRFWWATVSMWLHHVARRRLGLDRVSSFPTCNIGPMSTWLLQHGANEHVAAAAWLQWARGCCNMAPMSTWLLQHGSNEHVAAAIRGKVRSGASGGPSSQLFRKKTLWLSKTRVPKKELTLAGCVHSPALKAEQSIMSSKQAVVRFQTQQNST